MAGNASVAPNVLAPTLASCNTGEKFCPIPLENFAVATNLGLFLLPLLLVLLITGQQGLELLGIFPSLKRLWVWSLGLLGFWGEHEVFFFAPDDSHQFLRGGHLEFWVGSCELQIGLLHSTLGITSGVVDGFTDHSPISIHKSVDIIVNLGLVVSFQKGLHFVQRLHHNLASLALLVLVVDELGGLPQFRSKHSS